MAERAKNLAPRRTKAAEKGGKNPSIIALYTLPERQDNQTISERTRYIHHSTKHQENLFFASRVTGLPDGRDRASLAMHTEVTNCQNMTRIFRGDGMKYWITTFQATGIALFAGSVVASPTVGIGVFWGAWLIFLGFLFSRLHGGEK